MILLLSVLLGLLAGLLRARARGGDLSIPDLRLVWLAPAAFLPQLFAFQLAATSKIIPDHLAAIALVSSQCLFLVFAWFNRRRRGFWMLGLGLLMNLVVITLNGGLMPVSPETVAHLAPNAPPGAWQIGERLAATKDVVLPIATTRLWWLSDRFVFPTWLPLKVAFSVGDILIAAGAFWFLWCLGARASGPAISNKVENMESQDEHGSFLSQT